MAATVAYILKPDAPTAYCCCIYTVWTTYTRPWLLIVRWGVRVTTGPRMTQDIHGTVVRPY